MSDHSDVMNRANAAKLTYRGVRVTVSGAQLEFARVTVSDSKHPFYGWSTEYAWPTIARAIESEGFQ